VVIILASILLLGERGFKFDVHAGKLGIMQLYKCCRSKPVAGWFNKAIL